MRKFRKRRSSADCDTPHSYCSVCEMQLGPVPIDTENDYGRNGAHYLKDGGGAAFVNNTWFNDYGNEGRWITMVFRI